MKRVLLPLIGIFCASVANAADLPPTYKSAPVAAPYNWTGFYLGVNAGYGWASGRMNGVIGGGQAGYNWQNGNLVLGLETDIQATGQKGTNVASVLGVTISETDKLSWLGSTRLRAGFAADRWFFYGTGGAAYGRITEHGTVTGLLAGTYFGSNTKVGWTAGGGVEAAVGTNWSVKLEYLYAAFSGFTNTYTVPPATFAISYLPAHENIVRAGLNYRF